MFSYRQRSIPGTGRCCGLESTRLPWSFPARRVIRAQRRRKGCKLDQESRPHAADAHAQLQRPTRQHGFEWNGGGAKVFIFREFERIRHGGGTKLSRPTYGSSPKPYFRFRWRYSGRNICIRQ